MLLICLIILGIRIAPSPLEIIASSRYDTRYVEFSYNNNRSIPFSIFLPIFHALFSQTMFIFDRFLDHQSILTAMQLSPVSPRAKISQYPVPFFLLPLVRFRCPEFITRDSNFVAMTTIWAPIFKVSQPIRLRVKINAWQKLSYDIFRVLYFMYVRFMTLLCFWHVY